MNFSDLDIGRKYEIRLTGIKWDSEQGGVRVAVYYGDNFFRFTWKTNIVHWDVTENNYGIEVVGEYVTKEEYNSDEFVNSRPSKAVPTSTSEKYDFTVEDKVPYYDVTKSLLQVKEEYGIEGLKKVKTFVDALIELE